MPAANSTNQTATRATYDYGIVRVTPCVQRGEFLNVGVILFCRTQRFLDACIEFDVDRLRLLAPYLDEKRVSLLRIHLEQIPLVCAGSGPIGRLPQTERFHWLVAPRSTMIQVSPVHSGFCTDPAAMLETLMDEFVRV